MKTAGTKGVGLCRGGKKTCNGDGMSYGDCEGEVMPKPESCATLMERELRWAGCRVERDSALEQALR